jgi:hypothetical protein
VLADHGMDSKATPAYGLQAALYWGTALRATAVPGATAGHKAAAALGVVAVGVGVLGAVVFGIVDFILIGSCGEEENNMDVIFTNSHALSNKLCPLSARSMFLQSSSVQRAGREGKRTKTQFATM